MPEEFDHLNEDEKLKAENDFLTMKLMMEQGAHFGGDGETKLPAELENEFLKNVLAFEKQFEQQKTIKLFDKIGRPQHFKPVSEIPGSEIDKAWVDLHDYLSNLGINLDVCSPNISNRELYRFTIEELFEQEMDDMDLPGWTNNYIYDEFHPDPVYDNSRLVQQDLFHDIFRKEELFCELQYVKEGFVFNNTEYKEYKPYFEMISRFKSLFDEIELVEFNVTNCSVSTPNCKVYGNYEAKVNSGTNEVIFRGNFKVELLFSELGYWDMKSIQIEGFNPE
jgi:hypothetical protein